MPTVALTESGFQDSHTSAEWSIVLMADSTASMDRLQAVVETELLNIDAEIVRLDVETVPFS